EAAPATDETKDVGREVLDNLWSSNFPALRRVKIEVHGNTVTLHGHLNSFHERQIAISTANRVQGVNRVVDRLSLPAR
ncbi:MAG TPA: BON domain-containing protein, partial [Pirellulales bacterium]